MKQGEFGLGIQSQYLWPFFRVSNSGNLFSHVTHGVTVFIGACRSIFLPPHLPKTEQMLLQQNLLGDLAYHNMLTQEDTVAKSIGEVFDDIIDIVDQTFFRQ